MSYQNLPITRDSPGLIVFAIDQSGSMQDVMDPTNVQAMATPQTIDGRTYTHTANGQTKAQAVSDAVNRLLQNLVNRCTRSDGVRDYFSVGVIGYGCPEGVASA